MQIRAVRRGIVVGLNITMISEVVRLKTGSLAYWGSLCNGGMSGWHNTTERPRLPLHKRGTDALGGVSGQQMRMKVFGGGTLRWHPAHVCRWHAAGG